MGGTALGFEALRVNKDLYNKIWDSVKPSLLYPERSFDPEVLLCYRNKDSFGDMDVLVDENSREFLKSSFLQCRKVKENGPVISCGYDLLEGTFQIDLVFIPAKNLEISRFYFAYNDLGNLLGRIADMLDFSLGHDGLWYKVRDPNNANRVCKKILVSNTPKEILDFLGYDYEDWLKGFNSLTDIFDFVSKGPYFNPSIYLLENRNSEARRRDKKRSTYRAFLQYCEGLPTKYGLVNQKNMRELGLCKAESVFENFKDKVNLIYQEDLYRKQLKDLSGGKVIEEISKYKGKELGAFMKFFKQFPIPDNYVNIQYKDWINGYINGIIKVYEKLHK